MSSTTTRLSLPVRIALIVAAVLCAIIAGLAVTNLVALNRFNAATASLTSNIAAAQDDTTDLNTLKTRQQQTDAQFAEAQALDPVLLPSLKDAIDTNSNLSKALTKLLLEREDEQQSSSSSSSKNNSSDSNSSSSLDGLTDEQKQQVQDLLKSNQQTTDENANNTSGDDETTDNTSGNTAKPW